MNTKKYNVRELEDHITDYIDGTCSPEISAQIKAELERNDAFASLLIFEQQIADSLQLPSEYTPARSVDHNFTRLKARINEEENKPSPIETFFNWLKAPLPAMFAVCFAIFATVSLQSPINNEFTTLSDNDGSTINTENVHLIRVIFSEEQTQTDLNNFGSSYSLDLVQGPDSLGSYIFSLDKNKNADQLISTLENHSAISYAGKTVSP